MKAFPLVRLLLAGLLLCTLLTACAPDDTQVIVALFEEWAREKGFNPRDEEGNIDPWEAIKTVGKVASGIVTGSTGDEEADAAVGILSVVYPIKGFDQQVDKGIDSGDAESIAEAIRARPHDYHYANALGVVRLANGSEDGAEQSFADAERVWKLTNPNWSASYGAQANSRDMMASIDRAIQAEDKNNTPESGKDLLRKRYCSEARWYKGTTGSSHYLDRARNALKIDCSKY